MPEIGYRSPQGDRLLNREYYVIGAVGDDELFHDADGRAIFSEQLVSSRIKPGSAA